MSRLRGATLLAAVTALLPLHTAAAQQADGVPRVQHVVILVLENESFGSTWSASSPAKYLNGLVRQGAFVPNYYGTGHVSLDNYIAMTSGLAGPQVASTYTDCLGINLWTCVQEVSAAASSGSIADQVEATGLSWKQYSDGTARPCVHADYSATSSGGDPYQGDGGTPTNNGAGRDYADRHVPFIYYANIVGDTSRCNAHLRPFSDLRTDMAAAGLPSYAFVTPDTCNDGHDAPCSGGRPGGLVSADAFLAANLPPLLAYLRANDGVLFITFDEGSPSDTAGCCAGGPGGAPGFGGRVGMLVLGAPVAAGGTTTTSYDHASLLRTTEDMLGIGTHLGNAASSSPIAGIWAATTAAAARTASPSAPPLAAQPPPAAIALPDTSAPDSMAAPAAAALAVLAGVAVRGRRRRR